jgi:topoisomerase IA-like protein
MYMAGESFEDEVVFRLEDGAVWTQTDSRPLAVTPKRGQKVLIKRGALGGYMLSFEGTTGIKVRRTG